MKRRHSISAIGVSSLLSMSTALASAPVPASAFPLQFVRVASLDDPRARDAVDLFFDLCVGTYVPTASGGEENAGRFDVTNLSPDLAAKLSKGPVRSVEAPASNAMMLVSYEPARPLHGTARLRRGDLSLARLHNQC